MGHLRRIAAGAAAGPALAWFARRLASEGTGAAAQTVAFRHLIAGMASTARGRELGIERGMSYGRFISRVPVTDYEGLASYVARAKAGEPDVLWPGRCDHFALSSGTTAGPTKYIPVTAEMTSHFTHAGLQSLLQLAVRRGGGRVFGGRHLFLGGSTALTIIPRAGGLPPGHGGDLSGITALNMPGWVSALLYEPGLEIARMADWPAKLRAIAARTIGRDVALVAGIPSWLLVLAEELRRVSAEAGRPAATLRDIWPGLDACIHGGVPIGPFRADLTAALGEGVGFHEVYPASEGFIAAQDAEPEAGLRLMVSQGIYYEFVPLDLFDPERPAESGVHAVPLEGAREDEDYVLVMTTPAGLCRYVIGDVVRFTSLNPPRLVYAGRTRLQLSAFGEHVIEKELTDAVVAAAQLGGVGQFHVAPLFVDEAAGRRRGRHEWWIAARSDVLRSDSTLAVRLDAELARLNEDYAAKRQGGGMEPPLVRIVPPAVFDVWMQQNGKWGGQNKLPRCRSDRQVADALARIAGEAN